MYVYKRKEHSYVLFVYTPFIITCKRVDIIIIIIIIIIVIIIVINYY